MWGDAVKSFFAFDLDLQIEPHSVHLLTFFNNFVCCILRLFAYACSPLEHIHNMNMWLNIWRFSDDFPQREFLNYPKGQKYNFLGALKLKILSEGLRKLLNRRALVLKKCLGGIDMHILMSGEFQKQNYCIKLRGGLRACLKKLLWGSIWKTWLNVKIFQRLIPYFIPSY